MNSLLIFNATRSRYAFVHITQEGLLPLFAKGAYFRLLKTFEPPQVKRNVGATSTIGAGTKKGLKRESRVYKDGIGRQIKLMGQAIVLFG